MTMTTQNVTVALPTQPQRSIMYICIGLWLLMILAAQSAGSPGYLYMMFTALLAPPLFASYRRHKNALAIFVLTMAIVGALFMAANTGNVIWMALVVLAGSIAWLVSLVWSCTAGK